MGAAIGDLRNSSRKYSICGFLFIALQEVRNFVQFSNREMRLHKFNSSNPSHFAVCLKVILYSFASGTDENLRKTLGNLMLSSMA